jgi:hypothetical protein
MTQLLEQIPDPQVIREQLGSNVRQNRILRRLIRVAEDVKAERVNRPRIDRPSPQVLCTK